jgi:hypothetical protein
MQKTNTHIHITNLVQYQCLLFSILYIFKTFGNLTLTLTFLCEMMMQTIEEIDQIMLLRNIKMFVFVFFVNKPSLYNIEYDHSFHFL